MTHSSSSKTGKGYLFALSLGALGVVYGDIGTSPLYAMRECFHGEHGIAPTRENVLGVLSLVFWALIIVISIKYLVFVMRADNRGEGGILALTALVPHDLREHALERRWLLTALSLFGAALLYGDGMITPAISVLSAVEGLEMATPFFNPYVVPITIVILIALFVIQRHGTAGIGKLFGPVMILWFVTIGVLGVFWILRVPSVLAAVNPWHAVRFFLVNRGHGFLVLGAVFLVVTGGEALYADMGHFGRRPIRIAWFALVLPALLLNYFGQGALLVTHPDAAAQPFYEMVRRLAPGMLYPLVVLSTAAAVIASQAVISGAFSLTRQAVQLGYIPRIAIVHTSNEEIGQIYIPSINWVLMIACFGLVLGFKKSTNLAAAYGVAVTNAMVITTLLAYVVARRRWKWSRLAVAPVAITFLIIDISFFGSNIVKIPHGGWFPLLVGVARLHPDDHLEARAADPGGAAGAGSLPLEKFVENIRPESPDPRAGDGDLHVPRSHRRAHRAAAQPQAQQDPALAGAGADDDHRGGADGAAGGAARGAAARQGVLPRDRPLRVHAEPGGAGGAGAAPGEGDRARRDVDHLLPRPREPDRQQGAGHGDLAREAVRPDGPQRPAPDRLLPHPRQPGGRAGDAGTAVERPLSAPRPSAA